MGLAPSAGSFLSYSPQSTSGCGTCGRETGVGRAGLPQGRAAGERPGGREPGPRFWTQGSRQEGWKRAPSGPRQTGLLSCGRLGRARQPGSRSPLRQGGSPGGMGEEGERDSGPFQSPWRPVGDPSRGQKDRVGQGRTGLWSVPPPGPLLRGPPGLGLAGNANFVTVAVWAGWASGW